MANGEITKATAIGGATGLVGGPIGAAVGAGIGYLTSSGIFGGKKKAISANGISTIEYIEIGVAVVVIGVVAYLLLKKNRII